MIKRLFLILVLVLLAGNCLGAISIGNTANSGVLASVTSATFSLDNNKEDVIVLIALRDVETAATVSGVTYNTVAMTQDVTLLYEDTDTTADLRIYIFRLQDASTGSNNVVVTFSGTVDHTAVFAVAVADLNNTGQPDITGSTSWSYDEGNLQNPSTTITTVASDTILFDVVYNKLGTDFTVGSGQTIIGQLGVNNGGDRAFASYKIVSSSGSQTMSWNNVQFDDWDMAVAAYKQTSAPPAVTPQIIMNMF